MGFKRENAFMRDLVQNRFPGKTWLIHMDLRLSLSPDKEGGKNDDKGW